MEEDNLTIIIPKDEINNDDAELDSFESTFIKETCSVMQIIRKYFTFNRDSKAKHKGRHITSRKDNPSQNLRKRICL